MVRGPSRYRIAAVVDESCAGCDAGEVLDSKRRGIPVVASLKEAPDKIYLGRGVWAHTCLRYRDGGFSAPDHSFPDFRDGRFDRFMGQARRTYKSLLQSVDP